MNSEIGLTRRIEPVERIRELRKASVPFGFDAYALLFSDDAVSVEDKTAPPLRANPDKQGESETSVLLRHTI